MPVKVFGVVTRHARKYISTHRQLDFTVQGAVNLSFTAVVEGHLASSLCWITTIISVGDGISWKWAD